MIRSKKPDRTFTSIRNARKDGPDLSFQETTKYTSYSTALKQELMPLDMSHIKTQLLNKIGTYMLKNDQLLQFTNVLNSTTSQYSWNRRSSSTNNNKNTKQKTLNDSALLPNIIVQYKYDKEEENNKQYKSGGSNQFLNESYIKECSSTRPDTSYCGQNKQDINRGLQVINVDDSKQSKYFSMDGQYIVLQHQTENIDALMRNKYDIYFQNMMKLSSQSVDNNDLNLMEFFLVNTADSMIAVKQIDKATFFYNQLRIFYTYTSNCKGKCKALVGLANCSTFLHQSHQSIIFLKRALQYSWLIGDQQQELSIYEKMALNYFYMGAIEKSSYFHSRSLSGGLELNDSPVKCLAVETVDEYVKKIPYTFNDVTSLLLTYMSIPLLNMEEYQSSHKIQFPNYVNGVTPRAQNDTSKNNTYLKSESQELIDFIQNTDEEFTKQIPTPRFHGRVSFNFVNVRADIPARVRMNRHHFNPSFYSKQKENNYNEKWSDSTLFKLPLKRQIEMRINAPPRVEDISSKLLEAIKKSKLNDQEVLRSPINLNHRMKEQYLYNRDRNSKTFRLRLQRIFETNFEIFKK